MKYAFHIDFIINYDYVDKYNRLTNKGFARYLCAAATAHFDEAGYGLKDYPQTGLVWLLLGWKIKIYSRPAYNQKIHIETWSSGAEKVCSYRDYKMYDENNNLIAIASSKWALYNLEGTTLARITPEIMESFHNNENEHVFSEKVSKITVPKLDCLNTYNYSIMRCDIDTNQHVNNGKYFDIAEEVLPEEIFNMPLDNIEVLYKTQAMYGDSVTSFYYSNVQEHYVVIKSQDESKVHCVFKLTK